MTVCDERSLYLNSENIAMFHPLVRKDFPEGDIHPLGDKR